MPTGGESSLTTTDTPQGCALPGAASFAALDVVDDVGGFARHDVDHLLAVVVPSGREGPRVLLVAAPHSAAIGAQRAGQVRPALAGAKGRGELVADDLLVRTLREALEHLLHRGRGLGIHPLDEVRSPRAVQRGGRLRR